MQFWFSEQVRLYALILLCALLSAVESIVPLYRYGRCHLPHAFPNVVLALLLVLTNLVLSAGTARLADFAGRHGIGLPLWVVALSGRMEGLLRMFVVTPNMQKAHHSRVHKETDTNYSNIFSVWDRLCGTYTPRIDFMGLRYGLDGFDDPRRQSLAGRLTMPFVSFK